MFSEILLNLDLWMQLHSLLYFGYFNPGHWLLTCFKNCLDQGDPAPYYTCHLISVESVIFPHCSQAAASRLFHKLKIFNYHNTHGRLILKHLNNQFLKLIYITENAAIVFKLHDFCSWGLVAGICLEIVYANLENIFLEFICMSIKVRWTCKKLTLRIYYVQKMKVLHITWSSIINTCDNAASWSKYCSITWFLQLCTI